MVDWKSAYEQYVSLAPRWRVTARKYYPDDVEADGMLSTFITRNTQPVFDIPDPPQAADIEAAVQLREIWHNGIAQFYATKRDFYEYEDVYHAALALCLDGPWATFRRNSPGLYYRGQRQDQWRIVPSLFRPDMDEISRAADIVIQRAALTGAFSDALESARPGRYSEEQRVAIAQHYGQQSATHPPLYTWLLDLTTDSLIALFFASLDGQEGDRGVITRFSEQEWEHLSANGQNAFGPLRIIEVPEAVRIERQRGHFLDAPHPDLIDQYIGARLTFHQKPGLVFEDATLGITKSQLFPSSHEDVLAEWAQRWRPPAVLPHREWSRLATYRQGHLSSQDYEQIIQSWLTHWEAPPVASALTAHRLDLRRLAAFHAKLQIVAEQIEPTARSIQRLEGAVRRLAFHDEAYTGFSIDLETAVRGEYFTRAERESARALLETILRECERA